MPTLAVVCSTTGDDLVGCGVDMCVLSCFFKGCKTGSTTLVVSIQNCNVQKSWFTMRCTAVLFGPDGRQRLRPD